MNKAISRIIGILIAIAVFMVLLAFLGPWYTVSEYEQAVITQFGKPKNFVTDAGLHWKIPVVDKVTHLPKWIMSWDGEVKQFPTYDKRMILIDTTVRWRIKEPMVFYISLTNEMIAMARLDDILDAASRKVVSQYKFEEIVRSSNRIKNLNNETRQLLLSQGLTQEDLTQFPNIKGGRESLEEEMETVVIDKLAEMGIEVVTFNIKKVNYIENNLKSVYDSMIAERERIAQQFRSEGDSERNSILGNIEKEKKEIMAVAKNEARTIEGKADSNAAEIYNNAYNSNAATRDFYEFLKKMEMYKNVPNNTSLIISTDSEFFDFYKGYK